MPSWVISIVFSFNLMAMVVFRDTIVLHGDKLQGREGRPERPKCSLIVLVHSAGSVLLCSNALSHCIEIKKNLTHRINLFLLLSFN